MDSFWQRGKIGVWADHHPLVLITHQLFSHRYQRYLIRFSLNILSYFLERGHFVIFLRKGTFLTQEVN